MIKGNVSRRAVLAGIAVAPAVGHAAAERAKVAMLSAPMTAGADSFPETAPSSNQLQFTRFADWFKKIGEESLREQARDVRGLDPDLIERRLPLQTKVRSRAGSPGSAGRSRQTAK